MTLEEKQERQRRSAREWWRRNRESELAKQRERRAADPEAARARERAHYAANRERRRESIDAWRDEHPDRVRELRRASSRRNPDANRRRKAERRAREREAFVEHVEPMVVLESHDGVCGICGHDVDPLDFHVDHIVPLARGGHHSYVNTQPAHPFCNLQKHAAMPEEVAA